MIELTVVVSPGPSPTDLRRLRNSCENQSGVSQLEILVGSHVEPSEVSRMRNDLFQRARGKWVYFLDGDCELPDRRHLQRLLDLARQRPSQALGGYYKSPADARLWPRAYNSAGNLWLKIHSASGQALPVAGNFLLPKMAARPGFPFPEQAAFGGEEVLLVQNLKDCGINFSLDARVTVMHHCRHTLKAYLKRALHHGRGPRQRLRWRKMLAPALGHFAQEKPLVSAAVVMYIMTVWVFRLSGGRKCSRVQI